MMYVNFDKDSGEIKSCGPSKDDTVSNIEVEYSAIEKIVNFEEKMSDYKVIFDPAKRGFVLKSNHYQEVYNSLYQLEKYNNHLYDILLKIDIGNNTCELVLDESIKNALSESNVEYKEEIYFSVTEKNNPLILYKLLKFDLKKSYVIPFDVEQKDFSIYTLKKYESYVYEIK